MPLIQILPYMFEILNRNRSTIFARYFTCESYKKVLKLNRSVIIMKILLKDIKEERMDCTGEVSCDFLQNNGDDIKFRKPVVFNGNLRKGEDFVEISGDVVAEYETNCHACGEVAISSINFDLFETYRREPSDGEYTLIGSEVDFDEMILENIRLNLPVKILCKDDCKGVCTVCGKNLNNDTCDCNREEEKVSPFDVLKGLLDK